MHSDVSVSATGRPEILGQPDRRPASEECRHRPPLDVTEGPKARRRPTGGRFRLLGDGS
jgi:hypothetical protein